MQAAARSSVDSSHDARSRRFGPFGTRLDQFQRIDRSTTDAIVCVSSLDDTPHASNPG